MARRSPRARAGLRMLAASMAPSVRPAPTRVWISSMNMTMSPSACTTSLITALSRSSKSPLNFAPASSAPISSDTRVLPFRFSGTSPVTMRWAMPSAMAVLPTPGSPIRMGLFLERRLSTCSTLRISSSRPITGSSLPSRARSVRSIEKRRRAWYLASAFWSVTRWPPRISVMALSSADSVTPWSLRAWAILSAPRTRPRRICSRLTNSSLRVPATLSAASITL